MAKSEKYKALTHYFTGHCALSVCDTVTGVILHFIIFLWISQIYVNFYNLKGNLFTHKSMFHDENFPANVPLMEKRTIDWGPSFEKMTVSNNILRSDVIMFLLLKGGGYHRCQFHNSYK